MKLVAACLAGLAVLATPAMAAAPPLHPQPLELSAPEVDKIKGAINAVLFDPSSSYFDVIKAAGDGTTLLVCGTVNAKSRFGEYLGLMPFEGLLDRTDGSFLVMANGAHDPSRFDEIWLDCGARGVALQLPPRSAERW